MATEQHNKVDLRSAFAYFMVRWKVIVILTLVCALLATAFGYYRKTRKTVSAPVSYEKQVENARNKLTEEDAAFTEQVYSQYETYWQRLNNWNTYLSNSILQNLDPYNYSRLDLQYSVESGNGDVISAFAASLLGSSEYDEIAAATGIGPEQAPFLKELVFVTSAASYDSAVSPSLDGSKEGKTEVFNKTGDTFTGIMNIGVIGTDDNAVKAMETVIDKAVGAKAAAMTKGGTAVKAAKVSSILTRSDAKTLLNLQQTAILPMISTQTNRSNFVKNTVDTLTETQKTYFEILCQEREEEAEAKSAAKVRKVNMKKYVVVGAAAGFLLSLLLLYISFAFTGIIRTSAELTDNYGLSVLHRFRVGKDSGALGNADVLRNRGLEILGGSAGQGDSAASLATELLSMMNKAGVARLFVACDCDRENVQALMKELQKNLQDQGGSSIHVDLGSPMENEEDYKKLLADEAVLVAETIGRSRKETLAKLMEACKRNDIRVLGCATVLEDGKV